MSDTLKPRRWLQFDRKPDWVERAKSAFKNRGTPYGVGGDAVGDPNDPAYELRVFDIGQAAKELGISTRRYMSILRRRLGELAERGVTLAPRDDRLVRTFDRNKQRKDLLYSRVARPTGERASDKVGTESGFAALGRFTLALLTFRRDEQLSGGGFVLELAGKDDLRLTKAADGQGETVVADTTLRLLDRKRHRGDRVAQEALKLAVLASEANVTLGENPVSTAPSNPSDLRR